jgi:hypothetical protein
MNKNRSKSPSFDAIIKFFLMRHEIITRKDLQKLYERLDHLEALIRNMQSNAPKKTVVPKRERSDGRSAYQKIYDLFLESGQEFLVKDICDLTAYNDKKVRNIIYRLFKAEKIQRTDRGKYVLCDDNRPDDRG